MNLVITFYVFFSRYNTFVMIFVDSQQVFDELTNSISNGYNDLYKGTEKWKLNMCLAWIKDTHRLCSGTKPDPIRVGQLFACCTNKARMAIERW